MSFQSTVRSNIAAGVIGEIVFLGPIRAKPYILNSADADNNVIGRVFCETGTEGEAKAGGDAGVFAGILFNPKVYASAGSASGTLAPSLTLPNGTVAELLQMGEVFVELGEVAAAGDVLKYDDVTGVIGVGAPGVGETAIPNAVVSYFDATSPGYLAVIKLTN